MNDDRMDIAKWAKRSESAERLRATLSLAESEPDISVPLDRLDADPWLFNCNNGTINLKTGRLQPHNPADLITKLAPVDFLPDAPCPIFMAFMQRIFRGRPELIPYLQKVFGYALTGSTREECLFFLHGVGGNGKSKLLDTVMCILGDYAAPADRDLLLSSHNEAHPCNVADLRGRRLVRCSETNDGRRFDESKLKDLTGETRLKARLMRQDFFEFTATHKIFLQSNHKPAVRGTDWGFWRRMRLIPFQEVIPESEKDPELLPKLLAEAPGVLRWMVEGCLLWQNEGLGMPDEVAEATDSYRRASDTLADFLTEETIKDGGGAVGSTPLTACYKVWCARNGEHPLGRNRFAEQLKERGYDNSSQDAKGRKVWTGLRLRNVETLYETRDPQRP